MSKHDNVVFAGVSRSVRYMSAAKDRAIIDYDGSFVFIDLIDRVWELSGEPARDGAEKVVLASLLAPTNDVTVVTVTPPEGS